MSIAFPKRICCATVFAFATCACTEADEAAKPISARWIGEEYAKQLARLEELALRPVEIAKTAKSDAKLFSPAEILEARLEYGRGSTIVGGKRLDWKRQTTLTMRTPWRPAVTKLLYLLIDGRRLTVWEYRDSVVDKDRDRIEIVLILDAERLRELAQKKNATSTPSSPSKPSTLGVRP